MNSPSDSGTSNAARPKKKWNFASSGTSPDLSVKLPLTKRITGVAGWRRSIRNLAIRPLVTRSLAGVEIAAYVSAESISSTASGRTAASASTDVRASTRAVGRA